MAKFGHLLKSGLVEALFPSICPVCRSVRVQESLLCNPCQKKMIFLPRFMLQKIQDEVQDQEDSPLFVQFLFNPTLQKILHLLKYQNMKKIGIFLGEEIGKQMLAEKITDMDGIIPVPIHRTRERERGYNQSILIAQGISSVLQIPLYGRTMIRNRYTRSQTKLSKEERQQNVRDSFQVGCPDEVRGKSIVLVDDVITTGATINACAVELKVNGSGLILKTAVATPTF